MSEALQKIENAVVDSNKSVESKFIDKFFAKDGETVQEARERMKKEAELL